MDKDLTGADLDCALSKVDPKCEGCTLEQVEDKDGPYFVGKAEGTVCFFIHGGGFIRDIRLSRTHQHARRYSPSREWAQGGPIIEREQIRLNVGDDGRWWAEIRLGSDGMKAFSTSFERAVIAQGPTPLVAAMRCFVTSKSVAETLAAASS